MKWDELRIMNWDDLRIIQAVRHEGSYTGAATTLRIDETTVSRRLARMLPRRHRSFPSIRM